MEGKAYIKDIILDREIEEDSYLNGIAAVRYLKDNGRLTLHAGVTMLVGENGTGKSTLLEGIAVAFGFNPEGGSRNYSFSTNDTHSPLGDKLLLTKSDYPEDGFFLRAESLYNAATYLEELDEIKTFAPPLAPAYGGKSLHCQSHGESFLSIVQNRFRGNGLYILDEPEAALSPKRLLTLMTEIDRLVKHNSQLIIATHSPILMAFPGAEILELSESGISPVKYTETEHYVITRRFLENTEQMLKYLLEE